MSDLLVVVFDDLDEARTAREKVRAVQREHALSLDDAAVIVKDASGKVHMDGEVDRGVKVGAGVGAALGLFVMFLFPVTGIVLGALGGGLVGKMVGDHVDKKFVNEVSGALKPARRRSSSSFAMARRPCYGGAGAVQGRGIPDNSVAGARAAVAGWPEAVTARATPPRSLGVTWAASTNARMAPLPSRSATALEVLGS